MRRQPARALRIIAGALLSSDLDSKELLEISERLRYDRRWTERLSSLIQDLAHTSGRAGLDSRGPGLTSEPQSAQDFADELTRMFSRKRLRKLKALHILRRLSDSKSWKADPSRTLRENAEDLIRTLPGPKQARVLVARVAEYLGYAQDPYLRGLS